MQISYNWLQEYLPQPIALETLSETLTSIGLEVEAIEKFEEIKGSLEGLVIGEVITCEKHPNADKLKVTTVNIGAEELLHIVCGAPNVAAGQKVVVAPVGTTVHPLDGEPFLIKKAQIRGELSEGMICAEDEVGLGESHDGIMVLPSDAPVGKLAKKHFQVPEPDYTIHIGLTPNRSDAQSHIGVAKDVCAAMSHKNAEHWQAQIPAADSFQAEKILPIAVNVIDAEACPRYAGVVISGVKIAASPNWLQQRLKAIGLQPKNNVVDITNYILHEYGQPLHAFDYAQIAQQKIEVKCLSEGSEFVALDGKKYTLRAADLMICDTEKPLCMAGVYGGENSGVKEQTETVFIESAYFNPAYIRKSSLHHQLRTDAAQHFEKGVDVNFVLPALNQAVQMIVEIAGGKVASDVIDIYPHAAAKQKITINLPWLQRFCGKAYELKEVMGILRSLGFDVECIDADTLEVIPPTNKIDVLQPADVAEEVLRIDGLNNIDIPQKLSYAITKNPLKATRKWKEKLANYLSDIGFHEIITNSIVNSKYFPEETRLVSMLNSLTSELDVMRPRMLESGLEVLQYNLNRRQKDLCLYETGNTYLQTAPQQYQQNSVLALWVTGNIAPQQWQKPEQPSDLYYLKGIVSSLIEKSGFASKVRQEVVDNEQGKSLIWKRGQDVLAELFVVPNETLQKFDIKQPVFYAELNVELWISMAEGAKTKFSELPKFPDMRRDIALVMDKSIQFDKVNAVIGKQKIEALKHFELFDVFESEKIGLDKKSLALSFTFQLMERTLTDAEVDGFMKKIVGAFEKELSAVVRS